MSSNLTASVVSPEEKNYLGGYTNQTHETQTRLVLLDDNTFCYQFMGGALDLLAVGRWQLNADKKAISLQEIRPNSDTFPNFSDKRLNEEGLINIVFDGYSMSNATAAVFMTSESDALPKKLRPLFSEDQNSWASEYVLPSLKVAEAKYFYIGYAEVDQYQHPVRLKVFQYRFGDVQNLRIGFNPQAVNPLMNMSAAIEENILKVDGDIFGKKEILTADIFDNVRQTCVYPVLHPEKIKRHQYQSPDQYEDDEAMGYQPVPESSLKPIREFSVALSAIAGAPYDFVKADRNSFKFNDWSYLNEEYEKALSDKTELPNYLSVSAGLVKNNRNIKSYVTRLVASTNELFNKYSQEADKAAGLNIIDHFIDSVYPFIKEYRSDDEINKSIETLTSNALGTAISLKNEALAKKIYEKLLGPNFDIRNVKHDTLLYNLACDYSLKKEKKKMLEAITLAIAKGKNPENFKNDSDFSAYYQDPDFLKAVNTPQ